MKKKEAEKFGPGLEAFLDYLRYASEPHNIALTSCSEAEAATQDLLHSLELEDRDRTYTERLARRMKKIRRERRLAKDTVLRSGPIVDWVEKNAAVIKSLERLFGEIRKAEAKTTDRIYIPRTKILEEIEPGTGKAESIEGR